MTKKVKWLSGVIGMFIAAMVLVYLFREAILVKAGAFMAPEVMNIEGIADAVVLEGAEFIGTTMIAQGLEVLLSGKARRMVIVLHRTAKKSMPFAIQEDYPSAVRKELQKLGLKDSEFTVLVVPLRDPITLTSARFVLDILAKDGVKKVILISSGFHTRRSYLVYQHVALPHSITIYPQACFDSHPRNNWWNEGHGARHFLLEFQKLTLYIAMGHIPLKLSYTAPANN
jgi:hypothetical protein